jgi:hypothetical protein
MKTVDKTQMIKEIVGFIKMSVIKNLYEESDKIRSTASVPDAISNVYLTSLRTPLEGNIQVVLNDLVTDKDFISTLTKVAGKKVFRPMLLSSICEEEVGMFDINLLFSTKEKK